MDIKLDHAHCLQFKIAADRCSSIWFPSLLPLSQATIQDIYPITQIPPVAFIVASPY